MKGGFIGVDIFFVISGYLISMIIFENLEKGTFSFLEFYARRIKRIFPALLLVLIACLVFGWFALLAEEYKQLGKHIAAGAGFVSNIVLWSEAGYFDNAALTKPLQHLWSLGIEEQFYLAWPLFLWIAWKLKFNFLSITILTAILSLSLNLVGISYDAIATFYSPQTRFWELLGGSLLAWITINKNSIYSNIRYKKFYSLITRRYKIAAFPKSKTLSNTQSFTGLLLLICGFFMISKDFNFPGVWAGVPVLGTMLLISAGPDAWVNRKVLSNSLAVWFGLVSFPLYLWHWPLLSFARIIEYGEPSASIRTTIILISVVLAWLTYKIIERPIRFGKPSNAMTIGLVALVGIVGSAGFNVYLMDGLPSRYNSKLNENVFDGDIGHYKFNKYMSDKFYICTPEIIAKEALPAGDGFVRCMQSKPTPDVVVALVGDSHAEHLFPGIAEALPGKNVAFYIKASQPFLSNPDFENIFSTIMSSKTIKYVVLTTNGYQAPKGSTLERELLQVVSKLNSTGKIVYLTDDVPTFPFEPTRCKGKRWLSTKNSSCGIPAADARNWSAVYTNALEKVVESNPEVKVLRLQKYFCENEFCSMVNDKDILYRDNNHLNIKGSLFLGKRLIENNPGIFR